MPTDQKNALVEKFENVYRNNLHRLRHFANSYMGDFEVSKEIVQDVFMGIWDNLEVIDWDREMFPYLMVLTRNRCLNHLKHNAVRKKHGSFITGHTKESLNIAALEHDSSIALYGKEINELLNEAIRNMPDKIHGTFINSRIKGLRYDQIAEMENISIKTVEYRISVALKIIRKALKEYGFILGLILDRLCL